MRLKQAVCGTVKFLYHAAVILIVGLYVIQTLSFQNAQTSQTIRIKEYVQEPTSRHDAKEEDTSNIDMEVQKKNSGSCQRREDIVYIKTHKTGSSTVVNMLYRVALKYNISVLLFRGMPYPVHGIDQYYMHKYRFLWNGADEEIPSRFHMAAEHMNYERQKLDKVMIGTPLYTTTVREPLSHLRSVFNYFGMAKKFAIPEEYTDPVTEYIQHRNKYTIAGKRKGYHIANGISNMLGLPDKDMQNQAKVKGFMDKIFEEFGLFMVTEYMSESFILLRRTMCWEMTDVLFSSINVRTRSSKKLKDEDEIVRLHRQWNNADYALYERANLTFWMTIQALGKDYWDEVHLYKNYNMKIANYCKPVIQKMAKGPSVIHTLHREMEPLYLPASPWSAGVTIDPVWCAASHIDIMPFYNILRVKQIPQICKYLTQEPEWKAHQFRIDEKTKLVKMIDDFCAPNPENTVIPLDVLATRGLYAWA